MEIKVRYVEGAKPIDHIENGDWVDLRSRETIRMAEGQVRKIPLGVCMELPEGYEAHVVPRSSTFDKWGITMENSIGIIDNSYRGEWQFLAKAHRATTIHAGDRICQFRVFENQPKFELVEAELSETSRGDSGFGSTGVN